MKGFLAVALSLVPFLKQTRLARPVHFALSYDEEVGCRGAPFMLADLKRLGIKPAACIVGEPTNMQLVTAHKGIQVYRCRVQGHSAHSSLTPNGCNAIEYAAELICFIRKLANEIRQTGPFDQAFDVPFTSISTNMIQGGSAQNIIPALCEFYFEFRNLPQVKPHTVSDKILTFIKNNLLPQMQQEKPQASIELDAIAVAPSFESTGGEEFKRMLAQSTGDDAIHKVAYATEAGLFQQEDIPTIVCGPGSIEQAHRPDEFVAVEQLERCETFLKDIIKQYCGLR